MRTKTIAYHLDKRKWKIHQSGIDRAEKYGTGRRQCSSFTSGFSYWYWYLLKKIMQLSTLYKHSNTQKTTEFLIYIHFHLSSVQFSHSVVSDSLRPWELQHARPPVHYQLPELAQTHVHRVGRCHPAISSSVVVFSYAFNLSQPQSLFQWVSSSHQLAKVLELLLQHQSFQWTLKTGLI